MRGTAPVPREVGKSEGRQSSGAETLFVVLPRNLGGDASIAQCVGEGVGIVSAGWDGCGLRGLLPLLTWPSPLHCEERTNVMESILSRMKILDNGTTHGVKCHVHV